VTLAALRRCVTATLTQHPARVATADPHQRFLLAGSSPYLLVANVRRPGGPEHQIHDRRELPRLQSGGDLWGVAGHRLVVDAGRVSVLRWFAIYGDPITILYEPTCVRSVVEQHIRHDWYTVVTDAR
jgi:hypothetical protein